VAGIGKESPGAGQGPDCDIKISIGVTVNRQGSLEEVKDDGGRVIVGTGRKVGFDFSEYPVDFLKSGFKRRSGAKDPYLADGVKVEECCRVPFFLVATAKSESKANKQKKTEFFSQ
jgi:hypothetical protein